MQSCATNIVHSNHQSSTAFVTDVAGHAIQHLQYLPFGELFADQRHDSPYHTPYKFSAKEKDEESGYSYFGARYYDSDLSVWLSVDPLAGKYPSISAYAYCANNPVMLMDPNGMEAIIPPTQEEYEKFGITPEGQQRFDAILRNIESFRENEEFVYAFSQTTGLTDSEIKDYLTYGKGPKANITDGSWAYATGASSFSFGADIINYLGSISSNDENKLGAQAFGVAMVFIDELSHNGDMAYNHTSTSTGETRNNPGTQNWSLSPTFHRGGDSQIFGFGIETSTVTQDYTDRKGRHFSSGEILITSPYSKIQVPYSNLPKIPVFNMKRNISIGLDLLK